MLGLLAANKLEKALEKVIPTMVKSFLTPTIVLAIMTPIIFLVIGPIAYVLANVVGAVFSAAFNIPAVGGAIGGLLIGGFWQVFVMFGLHFGITPLAIVNLTSIGYDFLIAPNFACSFATAASVLAIYIKTKDQKMKSAAMPAFVSSICGVTEPAIYGITLPRIKIFVITCVASAIGGFIMGLQKCFLYMAGGAGIFGFTNFIVNGINPERSAMHGTIWAIAAVIVAMIIAFVFTFIVYQDDEKEKGDSVKKEGKVEIAAPMKGIIKELKDINDEVFAKGTMGDGIVIEPAEGRVYAPCDGVIQTFIPTGHAIGIVADSGAEILIHVGMDTVDMNGDGFQMKAKEGDICKKGQLLLEFDISKIKAAGHDTATPIVITNSNEYETIIKSKIGNCVPGDLLLTVGK